MTTTTEQTQLRVTAERMAERAGAFLDALDGKRRKQAQHEFDDEEERLNWHYTPPRNHGGITMGELEPPQAELARQLMASGLSLAAYAQAMAIIAIESVLGEIERQSGREGFRRDPALYHVTVFGEPGGDAPWGWRFQGHHISLNNVIAGGQLVAPLPTFFGSNPAECGGERPLRAEEDGARALLAALHPDQRERAIISPVAPEDIVVYERPHIEEGALPPTPQGRGQLTDEQMAERLRARRERLGLTEQHLTALAYSATPRGLSASEMDAGQREHLTALLHTYVDRMPEELASYEWGKLERAGLEGVHFAWAGPEQRRTPHYYRLQGPNLLVEYDNTQNEANHIHSVWRDPSNDWGADLLRQHYATAH